MTIKPRRKIPSSRFYCHVDFLLLSPFFIVRWYLPAPADVVDLLACLLCQWLSLYCISVASLKLPCCGFVFVCVVCWFALLPNSFFVLAVRVGTHSPAPLLLHVAACWYVACSGCARSRSAPTAVFLRILRARARKDDSLRNDVVSAASLRGHSKCGWTPERLFFSKRCYKMAR